MLVSIVIRTLNEAAYLEDLLVMIGLQELDGFDLEIIVVDSGSSDATLLIARRHGCRIATIEKAQFSFGRSLNIGCAAAKGQILVFISGHCVPTDRRWLQQLCAPVRDGLVDYSYGRQIGDDDSNFSERRIFAKHYSQTSRIPQEGFFCNNANASLSRAAWEAEGFDEDLTGLEDMALAKQIVQRGGRIGYVAEAAVFHHHRESWTTVRRRFEREALALQTIIPEIHLTRHDLVRYVISSVLLDWQSALRNGRLRREWWSILRYRLAQYIGSHAGQNDHRQLSRNRKDGFFYPAVPESDAADAWLKPHRRPPAHESQQPAGPGKELPHPAR